MDSYNLTMKKARKPTKAQEDMFVKCLEGRLWLVLGTHRTAASRARARASWQEIANLLNRQKDGTFKTWKQWSKYWKDRKATLKKKLQGVKEAEGLSAADPSNDLTEFEKGMLNVLMRVEHSPVSKTEPACSPQTEESPNREGSQSPADNAEDGEDEALFQLPNDEDQQDTDEEILPDHPTPDWDPFLRQRALAREEWSITEPFVAIEDEHPNNLTANVPRGKPPTLLQQERLLKCLEQKPWLGVQGDNQSGAARLRTRAAWHEIAGQLNSHREGAHRSWSQWAKYWRDKKAALKRKLQQNEKNQRSAAPNVGIMEFTDVEQGMLKIIARQERSRVSDTKPARSPQARESLNRGGSQSPADNNQRMLNIVMEVERSPVGNTEPAPSPRPQASPNRDSSQSHANYAERDEAEDCTAAQRPEPARPRRGNRDSQSTATPRGRRRVLGRKRRPLLAALAERFLAIEERRMDNETQMMLVLRGMSDAWLQQTRAIQDLASTLRRHY